MQMALKIWPGLQLFVLINIGKEKFGESSTTHQLAVYNHWTGLDWTGLSKSRACHCNITYDVVVQ